jgi:23S rRNA (uracil1939-C5)-methyltransferase
MARPSPPADQASTSRSATLVIDHLSAKAEGVARTERGPVFVPFALPGETVTATVAGDRGTLDAILTPAPGRNLPFCPHFARCGGCATQHMAPTLYRDWKAARVVRAITEAGLGDAAAVRPLVDAGGDGRRRVTWHVAFRGKATDVGFMEARSHSLLPLDLCPILVAPLGPTPALVRDLVQPLRGRGKPLDVQVTASDSGLDVDIRGHGMPDDAERLALTERARVLDLARVSIHGETLTSFHQPTVAMGRASVPLPPKSFLQATEAGETALAEAVIGALAAALPKKAKHVADLFAGVGPFALQLAETIAVHAVDSDLPAITALRKAHAATPGLKAITAEARDLFRRPLLPRELDAFDAVITDPPRAGAEAQMRQIATAGVATVISVSCDLKSFVRDGLILRAAGFRLVSLTPIDQFVHSPHIELVGLFRR